MDVGFRGMSLFPDFYQPCQMKRTTDPLAAHPFPVPLSAPKIILLVDCIKKDRWSDRIQTIALHIINLANERQTRGVDEMEHVFHSLTSL